MTGFAVIVKLYQKIYGERGYYCEWTNEVALLFSHRIGLGGNVVSEIVSAAINRGIFDKNLFDKYQILSSTGIQKRYFEAVSRRKQIDVVQKYLLIDATIKSDNVRNNHINVDINSQNASNNPQSKRKESKVNKSIYSPPPLSEIYALFNRICTNLTPVQDIPNASRERAVFNIWNAYEDMDKIKTVFTKAQKSDFLSGKSKGWKASFDWLMKQENFVKVYEGNYDNQKSSGGGVVGECTYDMDAYERMINTVPTLR